MATGDEGGGASGRACLVRLEPSGATVQVPEGALLLDALARAGLEVPLPCGGQGRCGRCVVVVQGGEVRRRSVLRLTEEEVRRGYALACQTIVTGDVTIWVPPQSEDLERLESADRANKVAPEVLACAHRREPWVACYGVTIRPPSMTDSVADLARLFRELTRAHGLREARATLGALRALPAALRAEDYAVTAVLERGTGVDPDGPARLLDVYPGRPARPLLGLAVDIGTTSVVAYLADLETGALLERASAYNAQIACGEDIISRIIYAREPARQQELQERVIGTINELVDDMLARRGATPESICLVTVAGNTTMLHLFLRIEPKYIRLEPYLPAAGRFPPVLAGELGLRAHPDATVDCLPVVGAYVGGDITAGVLRSGMHEQDAVTLFIDIGTNGEMVLGNREWLISCACSAGPAFEGAGAASGTRAVRGAIEEVWIDPGTLEPTWRTLGGAPPVGICGSGMIALLGEMVWAGIIDKGGRLVADGRSPRVRRGENGPEYVVAWATETRDGQRDVTLSETDIQNLLRAKAAIYAGASVLCDSVGLAISDVERVLIGGAFGQHLDVEKASGIGLLPDMPWDRFVFLGNTSVQGAYLAMTCREHRAMADALAAEMTYLELSADNRFMEAFTSALFIPHTDVTLFPSVRGYARERRPT